jgi:hypothetical protein
MVVHLQSGLPLASLEDPLVPALLALSFACCKEVAFAIDPLLRQSHWATLNIRPGAWRYSIYADHLVEILQEGRAKGAFQPVSLFGRAAKDATVAQWQRQFDIARMHRPQVALAVASLIWPVYQPVSLRSACLTEAES